MRKLTTLLLRWRKAVIVLFLALTVICGLMIFRVHVNYDLSVYLPEESQSKQALDLLKRELSYAGSASLMAEDISVSQALALKADLERVEGVDYVLWLDDVADVTTPMELIDASYTDTYYKDQNALFFIYFEEDDYSLLTGQALADLRELAADYHPSLYGNAESSRAGRQAVTDEMINIMVVIVPICLVILILISSSWFEPVLYIFVICVAVVINMGTNALLDSVSYIIFAMGAAIQLAVSMDYSLFFTHRFDEERKKGLGLDEAIIVTAKATFPSIAASALTTVAGFAALALMQYGIGRDIGIVLAKGVFCSFLCVVLLLPPSLRFCYRLIERSGHRTWLKISPKLARAVTAPRYLFLVLGLALLIPAYLGQQRVDFLYGDSSGTTSSGALAEDMERIADTFPLTDQIVIIVPKGNIAAEAELCQALEDSPYVETVQSLVTLASPAIPRDMLPPDLVDNFEGENYAQIVVYTNAIQESPYMFQAVDFFRAITRSYYGNDCYLVGKALSVDDVRDSVRSDLSLVQWLSMGAVGVIIMFTFRSIILPLLLVLVIQTAIYINMSIPYFLGDPLVFIGYIVVSALQLGATIDYAILTTSRYMEARRLLPPREAVSEAWRCSGISVITSGLILATAGFCEAFLSSMAAVSDIGLLIGRGAVTSLILVLLMLPGVLTGFDKPIRWLSLKTGFYRRPRRPSGRPQDIPFQEVR